MTLRSRARDFAYRRVGGSVAVLVYHRVADLPTDPQLLAATPARFEEHARMLAERFTVLPLSELAVGLARRTLPKRAVAITFDDGYADNLHSAAPALERHGLPATVFVSSGYTDATREYWWDELERLILLADTLPERIQLEAGGTRFSMTLTEPGRQEPHAPWNVTVEPQTERHRLYLDLAAFVQVLDAGARREALDALREQVGADPTPRATHLPLSVDEVAELERLPGIDIGGHTVNHVRLAALPAHEQLEEVSEDRARLTEILGTPPRTFAYPYGSLGDFDADSIAAVRAAGYDLACANYPRPVKPWSDPLQLPRFLVRDWEADDLEQRLERWFGGSAAWGDGGA